MKKLQFSQQNILVLVIFVGCLITSVPVYSQGNLTIKTTESYLVDIPNFEYRQSNEFTTWKIDTKKKIITHQICGKNANVFEFDSFEVDERSTDNKSINHFSNSSEFITLIIEGGNYLKVQYFWDKVESSSSPSFRKGKVFTNYFIEGINQIMIQ